MGLVQDSVQLAGSLSRMERTVQSSRDARVSVLSAQLFQAVSPGSGMFFQTVADTGGLPD